MVSLRFLSRPAAGDDVTLDIRGIGLRWFGWPRRYMFPKRLRATREEFVWGGRAGEHDQGIENEIGFDVDMAGTGALRRSR